MKKKKGFTLIELLAVIVILAIIALIAVPVIMNVLTKANKSAFKDTAYGIISAGELYFAEQQLELNGMSSESEFTWPNNIGTLQVKGNVPDGTVLKVSANGETALAMSNGRYCVTKGYKDRDITITESTIECNIPTGEPTFAQLTTTNHACTAKGQICTPGETLFTIKVNDIDTYDFFVLSDDGSTATLIMSENLGEDVGWVTPEQYNDDDSYGQHGNNNKGPLTALMALEQSTSDWTNLPQLVIDTFDYEDGTEIALGNNMAFTTHARLPKYSDLKAFERYYESEESMGVAVASWDAEGPVFLAGNYYWLSTAKSSNQSTAWAVDCAAGFEGDVCFLSDAYTVPMLYDEYFYRLGIRPVITLTK